MQFNGNIKLTKSAIMKSSITKHIFSNQCKIKWFQ